MARQKCIAYPLHQSQSAQKHYKCTQKADVICPRARDIWCANTVSCFIGQHAGRTVSMPASGSKDGLEHALIKDLLCCELQVHVVWPKTTGRVTGALVSAR